MLGVFNQKEFDYLFKKKRFLSAFSLPEIDKILEERLSGDVIFRGKTKYPYNVAMLGEDDINTLEDPTKKLPTELLHRISSLLRMKDAAAMGILSRDCRYLWRTYGKLDFDLKTITGEFIEETGGLLKEEPICDLQQKLCMYVRWVNEVLKLHCGPKIESFRVACCLEEEHYSNIDEWIQFAVNKGVQELNITLFSYFRFDKRKPYKFPHWLFTKAKHDTLKHLSLDMCSMDIPSGFVDFRSLTSLTLRRGTMTQETLTNILSNCLSLEWFSITSCDSPFRLQFGGGGTSLKLRHLNISSCSQLKEIEVYDGVQIASFEYEGRMLDRLLFKNGEQVGRLCFDINSDRLTSVVPYALGRLSSDFPKLETLMLSMPCLQDVMIPQQLPLFSKLRRLVLTFRDIHQISLLNTVSTLLKMSPFMRKFELHLKTGVCRRGAVQEFTPFRHEKLKVVEMYNFAGSSDQVEVALYLFNSCVALKRMKIDRHCRHYQRDGEWDIGSIPLLFMYKLKHAYQLLQRKAPPSVKLVVL